MAGSVCPVCGPGYLEAFGAGYFCPSCGSSIAPEVGQAVWFVWADKPFELSRQSAVLLMSDETVRLPFNHWKAVEEVAMFWDLWLEDRNVEGAVQAGIYVLFVLGSDGYCFGYKTPGVCVFCGRRIYLRLSAKGHESVVIEGSETVNDSDLICVYCVVNRVLTVG